MPAKVNINNKVIMIFCALLLQTFFIQETKAETVIKCKVITIEASAEGSLIDEKIQKYADIFSQNPFASFTSFKLIKQNFYKIKNEKKQTLSLPDKLGGTLEYTGLKNNKLNFILKLTNDNNKTVTLNGSASPGAPFIAAGLRSDKGRWIIIIECDQ